MISKIKLLRIEQRIDQEFLCDKLHMSQSTFSRKEKYPSRFTDEQFETLAEIFKKPVHEIVDETGNININNVQGVAYNNGELIYNSKELFDKLEKAH